MKFKIKMRSKLTCDIVNMCINGYFFSAKIYHLNTCRKQKI